MVTGMELELKQETVQCWETACRTTIEQEETAEMIVPDARPDIFQVVDGETRLLLQRKEPQEGKAEFSGLLKTTILYRPEGEGGLQTMEVTLPFSASPELSCITRRSVLRVTPRVLSTDVHLLNPRKVLVRVGCCLELEVFSPQVLSPASFVEDAEGYGVRQRPGTLQSLVTVCAQEKDFTYSDVLTLPAGRPDAVELLRTRTECGCSEAKVIGSKLVFKGEAVLKLLCKDQEGGVFTADFHLPYSQIMEVGECSEDSLCALELFFSDVKCALVEGEQRSFQVDLALQAQAVLREQVEVPVLTDLYSTGYALEAERSVLPTLRLVQQDQAQETLREVLPLQEEATGILDVQVRLGRLDQSQEGKDLALKQQAELMVLYETGEGPAGVKKTITVAHRIPEGGAMHCHYRSELLREPTAVLTEEGVEVSFPLAFYWMLLEKGSTEAISHVTLGEPWEEAADQPSVVLRAVRNGESLWDVAKAYRSSDGAIMEATGLTSGELYPGQMLLIPRKSS